MTENHSPAPRILVVDDSAPIRDLYRVFLESEGFEVLLSADVFTETAEVERLKPDLIILDYFLGGQPHGWEMLEMLQAEPATADIPLIMVSGVEEELRQVEHALKGRGVPLLLKPFELDELLAVIQEALQKPGGQAAGADQQGPGV